MGFLGEGHAGDGQVWVAKSHHPYDLVSVYQFKVNKMIYLMRSPIDTFVSLAHLFNLNSHSDLPVESYEKDCP